MFWVGWSPDTTTQISPPASGGTSYLTTDHLGSTRIVTGQDQSIKVRHDSLPFGEEIDNIGGRSPTAGYTASDPTRQRFTQKERDAESGLDYFLARYYSGPLGRFTGVDPENAGANAADAQSWNGYGYARNNPMIYTDPDGLVYRICDNNGKCAEFSDEYIDGTLRNKKLNPDIKLKNGNILQKNKETGKFEQIGTFTRPSFDDLPSGANQLVNEMAARASAMNQAIAGFAIGTVIIGATGGAALYVSGAMAGSGLTTLGLEAPYGHLSNAALNELIGAAQREILKKFFGKGVEGARAARANFRLPAGLSRETLQIYREVALRAIREGKDLAGTQAVRLKLVEKALEAIK